MRRTVMFFVFLIAVMVSAVAFCTSCAQGITPFEAANGKAKCGRSLR